MAASDSIGEEGTRRSRGRSGDFPFPLTDDTDESRYLTWIRHHSNYMALRGTTDYLRSLGVLVRGILINLLILAPSLLVIALVLGTLHGTMLEYPFVLSKIAFAVWLLHVLAFPLVGLQSSIVGHKRTLEFGSSSTVGRRDLYEQTFGWGLLLVAAVFVLEAFPYVLAAFHEIRTAEDRSLSWSGVSWLGGLSLGSIVALAAASNRLLEALGGFRRKLAITLLATLGLLVPSIAVLCVSDYLIYGQPLPSSVLVGIGATTVLGIFAVLVFLWFGIRRKIFTWEATRGAVKILVVLLTLSSLGIVLIKLAYDTEYSADGAKAELLAVASQELLCASRGMSSDEGLARESRTDLDQLLRPLGNMLALGEARRVPGDPYRESGARSEPCPQTGDPEERTAVDPDRRSDSWPERLVMDQERARLGERIRQEFPSAEQYVDEYRLGEAIGLVEFFERRFYTALDHFAPEQPELLAELRDRLDERTTETVFASLDSREIRRGIERHLNDHYRTVKLLSVVALAIVLWVFCWLAVDVNSTSIHALYRDRLASTFLIGRDEKGEIGIEHDVDLDQICCYAAGSTAPYHLVNAALNLQGSDDVGVRNRKCGFFVFSKRFVGSMRTGYCRSEVMEQVFPQMSLATAMAISAAAASPNMGRSTSPGLVAFLTMLNIRLGIWIPNPGRVEERKFELGLPRAIARRLRGEKNLGTEAEVPGFAFADVFDVELDEMEQRWEQTYGAGDERGLLDGVRAPAVGHRLVGLALSGGGIRSATLNLGIVQTLAGAGVFRHVDYLSTVSGGGYLGASISTLMRSCTRRSSPVGGRVSVDERDGGKVVTVRPDGARAGVCHEYSGAAELTVVDGEEIEAGRRLLRRPGAAPRARVDGVVGIAETGTGERIVTIDPSGSGRADRHAFTRFDQIIVGDGQHVRTGDPLIAQQNTFADRFRWRVRPAALFEEVFSLLDSRKRWVNLSDGGHIENLAVFELLRRRCRYVVAGDGEADPLMHFNGLATLIRTARIDLGVEITIDLDDLRLADDGYSREHWTVGRIRYPNEADAGYLLYLKSSVTGDEDAAIGEYRHRSPTFPHESTADQFFVEDQFEAYRALGQHIAEGPARLLAERLPDAEERSAEESVAAARGARADAVPFGALEAWFEALDAVCRKRARKRAEKRAGSEDGETATASGPGDARARAFREQIDREATERMREDLREAVRESEDDIV